MAGNLSQLMADITPEVLMQMMQLGTGGGLTPQGGGEQPWRGHAGAVHDQPDQRPAGHVDPHVGGHGR